MKINTRKKSYKKPLLVAVAIILVAAVGYGAFAYANDTWPFKDSEGLSESDKSNPTDKLPSSNSSERDGKQSDSSGITSTKDDTQTTSLAAQPNDNVTPQKPVGTFVSNHHPNLSGSPAPNQMSSTCATTPGASCTIRFKKDNSIKSLPIKVTNKSGNITWNWKLQDIGLTAGDWQITAVATNGDKVAKASDSMLLSIRK